MKRWLYVHTTAAQFILTMVLGAIFLVAMQALGFAPFWAANKALETMSDPRIAFWAFPGYVYLFAALFTVFLIGVNGSLSRHLERELDMA